MYPGPTEDYKLEKLVKKLTLCKSLHQKVFAEILNLCLQNKIITPNCWKEYKTTTNKISSKN